MGMGTSGGRRLLSRTTVETMTTDQLTDAQRETSGPDPTGAAGWGFGVSVQVQRTRPSAPVGTYGWDGGLGTVWHNDPVEGVTGILLTNQAWSSPVPPAISDDFWTATYAALDD
jgi:CubicO group peptidase (beta-lactamase class C family)